MKHRNRSKYEYSDWKMQAFYLFYNKITLRGVTHKWFWMYPDWCRMAEDDFRENILRLSPAHVFLLRRHQTMNILQRDGKYAMFSYGNTLLFARRSFSLFDYFFFLAIIYDNIHKCAVYSFKRLVSTLVPWKENHSAYTPLPPAAPTKYFTLTVSISPPSHHPHRHIQDLIQTDLHLGYEIHSPSKTYSRSQIFENQNIWLHTQRTSFLTWKSVVKNSVNFIFLQ